MPRWASRVTLKITDVRIEAVQEITEEDAICEGCFSTWGDFPKQNKHIFSELWNSIYEKEGFGWDENPWVWVIDFEVLKNDKNKKE